MTTLREVELLLRGEFRSVAELNTTIRAGLAQLDIPAPERIAFWQFVVGGATTNGQFRGGEARYGVHLELDFEGVRYRFERAGNGLRTISLGSVPISPAKEAWEEVA